MRRNPESGVEEYIYMGKVGVGSMPHKELKEKDVDFRVGNLAALKKTGSESNPTPPRNRPTGNGAA